MSTIFLRFFSYLLVLFQLIIEVKSQKAPFKPSKRGAHTATFIDGKLYILGGYSVPADSMDEITGQEFFYLDVSETFTTTKDIKWVNLTNMNSVPPHRWAASARGGENNNMLFLYGGHTYNGEMALVYTFDTQSNLWNIPITENYHPLNKNGLAPIIDDNGRMYLFAGFLDDFADKNNYVDDMTILDTINLRIKQGNSNNVPIPRGFYGAVLLPNQKIIYIGGFDGIQSLPLNIVYLYDITSDEWSIQMTRGQIVPSNRNAFSAVLGLDDQKVIVYGGSEGPHAPDISIPESLYVLDVNNWKWYIPEVSGNPPLVVPYSHKANVIGKYMVITFGNRNNNTADINDLNEVSLLDISDDNGYKWSNTFTPPDPTNTVPPTTSNPTVSSNLTTSSNPITSSNPTHPSTNRFGLVGAILCSLVGCTLLTVGCFFLYKKRKNHQLLELTISLSKMSIPDFD